MSKLFYTIPSPVPDDWRLTTVHLSLANTASAVLPFSRIPYYTIHRLRRATEKSGALKLHGQKVHSPVWLNCNFFRSVPRIICSVGQHTDLILGTDDRFVVVQKRHAAPTAEAIYLLGQMTTTKRQSVGVLIPSYQVHLLELRTEDYQKMNQDILEHLADDFGLLGLSLDCSTFPLVTPIAEQE